MITAFAALQSKGESISSDSSTFSPKSLSAHAASGRGGTPRLTPAHLQQLVEGSGIAPDVIGRRGAYTATTPAQLAALGFAEYQRRVPALVLPVYDVHGQCTLHQIRPDSPRKNKKGKILKYDTPEKHRLVLDVAPDHLALLQQATVPLVLIEGLKKKDAVVSHLDPARPLCPIGLIGTYGWMRQGKPLPDWQAIILKGRQIILTFPYRDFSKYGG